MNRSAFSGNPRLLRLVTGCGTAACAGLHAIALVDIKSGRCLFAASAPTDVAADLDVRRAARHQATILRAQIENGIDLFQPDEEENGGLEDIVLTTRRQYHLISFVPQPDYSGLFAVFPVMGIVLAAFSHRASGTPYTIRLLRGMVAGFYAFTSFCLGVALAVPRLGVAGGFAVALAFSLAVHCCTLWAMRRGRRRAPA